MTAHATSVFADACGQRRPLRLAVDDATGDRIADGELNQPFARIGSAPDCDVVLTHASIPDQVAFLQVIDGDVFVVGLADRSIHRLTEATPIRFGPFVLRLLVPPTAAPLPLGGNPAAHDSPGRSLPRFWITPASGPEPRPRPVTQRLTLLGDGPGAPTAYLTLTSAGLFVLDLLSDTRVNGTPVRLSRLSGGDELTVGREQYSVQCEAEEPAAASRLTEALLGGGEMTTDATTEEPIEALVPLTSARPSAPYPARVHPDLAPLLRQVGDIQCRLLDQLRRELDELVSGFDSLRREQLIAFGAGLTRLRDTTAQLTLEPPLAGVTTLGPQPIEPQPAPAEGDVYTADGNGASEESAALQQAMFERLATLSDDRPGLWHRLRGLLGPGAGRP